MTAPPSGIGQCLQLPGGAVIVRRYPQNEPSLIGRTSAV
jgi:hypothetical protein